MSIARAKRATKYVPIFLDAKLYSDLENSIVNANWPYKSANRKLFQMRDHALIALLILSGLRIGDGLAAKSGNSLEFTKAMFF